jgi:hypothetical protein
VQEPDLLLGGVHVDLHLPGRQLEIQVHPGFVGLGVLGRIDSLDRAPQLALLHWPPVYEEDQHRAAADVGEVAQIALCGAAATVADMKEQL